MTGVSCCSHLQIGFGGGHSVVGWPCVTGHHLGTASFLRFIHSALLTGRTRPAEKIHFPGQHWSRDVNLTFCLQHSLRKCACRVPCVNKTLARLFRLLFLRTEKSKKASKQESKKASKQEGKKERKKERKIQTTKYQSWYVPALPTQSTDKRVWSWGAFEHLLNFGTPY